ncbi:ABC transporter substrate-binding protein [Prauserella cavernicola]|uniref:ABC transporter substrate-binding protein n=1 Tax=Prauserella cavernicola TaxID=2800127 RepID=A0A934QZX1_9PSEU|nr:ABC transporter substrate-binding protein [Prauserella cavernicola]MBK1789137.1 ABC transporter substrate-binding protein [Prauserella cavernicola]
MLASLALLSGCADSGGASGPSTVKIGYQQSVLYVPLLVMKEKGWLSEQVPEVDLQWTQLASGAALRDAMVTGDLQIGMIGIGAFNVGLSKGLDWKYMMSNADLDAAVMVSDPGIKTFEDLARSKPRISTIAPDSPQAFMLKIAARQYLGDPNALDESLVTLDAPSAVQALQAGQIDADTATSPSRYLEEGAGAHAVLTSNDVFAGGLLGVGPVAREGFKEDNQAFSEAFVRQLGRAVRWVQDNPEQALDLVSAELFGPNSNRDLLLKSVKNINWTVEPKNVLDYSTKSAELGVTDRAASSEDDMIFADLVEIAKNSFDSPAQEDSK